MLGAPAGAGLGWEGQVPPIPRDPTAPKLQEHPSGMKAHRSGNSQPACKATGIHPQGRAPGAGGAEQEHVKGLGRLPSTRALHCQRSPAAPAQPAAQHLLSHTAETELQAGGDTPRTQVLWGQGSPGRPSAAMGRGTGHQKGEPHIFKSPSGLPCPQGCPAQRVSNDPFPQQPLFP